MIIVSTIVFIKGKFYLVYNVLTDLFIYLVSTVAEKVVSLDSQSRGVTGVVSVPCSLPLVHFFLPLVHCSLLPVQYASYPL